MENHPFRPASPAERLPAYYQDTGDENIQYCFRDFDSERNFDLFDRQTREHKSSNFCIDFGEDDAYCAFDLDAQAYKTLLNSPRPTELHTRWINIWMPYNQKDLIRMLASHFDFTPRLLGMMNSDPMPPRNTSSLRMKKSSSTLRSMLSHASSKSSSIKQKAKQANEEAVDSESSIGMTEMMQSTQLELVRDLSHYQLVDDVWHWSTVDQGRRYMCIGYNSLHNVRSKETNTHPHIADRSRDVPHGKRVWNWLLLCEDKTVISISEDPFPFATGALNKEDLKTLFTTRRNLVNVFRQLTKAPTPLRDTALTQLPIRQRLGSSDEETAHRPTDAPGLLFYYLFEDWGATFDLISRREHGYAAELDRLRQEMLQTANLTHVDQLHHIGCQLAVLKRVYHSYELIIERVLKKQEATLASLKNSHILPGNASLVSSHPVINDSPGPLVPEADSLLGVALSSAARVRFERLKDRILLYALSEINECLDQKESLVMMNFNLIAIKESFSVERLTWVTLLLAKITILFTPVTLMTGYFSIQFKEMEFEMRSYWQAFGIIFGASVALLVLFSWHTALLLGDFAHCVAEMKIFNLPLSGSPFGKRASFYGRLSATVENMRDKTKLGLPYARAVYAAKHSHGSVFDVITTATLEDPAADNLLVNVCYTAHVVVYEPLNRDDWKPLMSTKPRDSVEETLDTFVLLLQHALSTDMAGKKGTGDMEL
ncbi:adp-ribosylation factor protein [Alternaria burnsii]|uniref:Adp-ribosylation factor protein n=1 Tax=Alternaria burnsii TaxID=1187904 RepID=A0A8H7B8S9_9PLEO|nr:adp-ribosylation factor protein [Alternaria burnsii]KAF7676714.1 adp-ribosylation factor protein [Alternaria burnsii]